jgi:hypothetical protein
VRTLLTQRALTCLAAAGGIAALAACSAILGVESDRYVATSDGGDEAGGGGPDWSCLGASTPDAGSGSLTVKFFLNDVTTAQSSGTFAGDPIVDASLQACSKLDFSCGQPLLGTSTDDAGIAFARVPAGFDGYYEVRSTDFPPSILKRTPQLASEFVQQGLAKTSLIALGGQFAQVTVHQDLAFVVVTAADCQTNPAPGVTFQVAPLAEDEKLVYLENSLPSPSATETDATGSAIVYNVPAGTVSLSATIAATGTPLRTVSAMARNGWATFIQVRLDSSHEQPP